MTATTLLWIGLILLVLQTPGGYGQWNGLTSYVPLSAKSLDMLFIFDTSNAELFEQSKMFTVDTLAAADIDNELVHVGLVTFTSPYFFRHHELDNGMSKNDLVNTILSLPVMSMNTISTYDEFSDILSETNGGRPYVSNITVVFVSNYSSNDITSALQLLQLTEFDSEVNIVGIQLYNSTDLMSYASHSYIADDVKQLDSFTATTFFTTFTDDCGNGGDPATTTTAAPSSETLEEWSTNTRNNLILDTSTLSSTIRKKTSAPDSRPSSTVIGYLGFVIVLTTFVLPIIVDIPTFIRHAKLSIKYQKKYRNKMNTLKGK
ncbi:uncharacterized protein LOC110452403 [Mizuhopecten yessoensis]|uniref:VWFA domain-containing protein n=1 Tax=Mizuhopecten yessoensis TaxID=6573 RepID=A0A210QJI9_MIZYE|nr:uncharacterized protein LOC110452403 [Mizuhopecten yessoensis]OWF48912.1 hypothetical protein KP79_PYT12478 [Mizuhopecten yessoensis]